MMRVEAALCVLLLCGGFICTLGDRHSLYYIYTALNKDIALPGVYEFTALGLLDDRAIDSYNSKEQLKVPKQDWMKEKMWPDYWEKGTQSRKSKEQWFKVNLDILMQRMNHSHTDLHVLQWRHGCEINEFNGTVTFLKGINEYGYDGKTFLAFDDEDMRWISLVPEAMPTKDKWDHVPILNQYTKGYLEKECVDWLTKFMEYGQEALRKHSPHVHMFAKKSATDSNKLTCMATGFYPKDLEVILRRFRTSLPENLLTFSEIRPNEDGTYQLRKSVDIQEDDASDYDCYVTHSSLDRPVIKEWERPVSDSSLGLIIGGAIVGFIVLLAVLAVLVCRNILKKKSADPPNLKVVKTTSTSVKVKWEKARGEIDRYILLASPQRDGSAVSRQIEVSSGEDSAVIDCLEPGCLYEISLWAEKNSKQSRKLTVQATTEPTDDSVSGSNSRVGTGSNNSSRQNSESSSETASRRRRVADDPDEEEQKTLLSSTAETPAGQNIELNSVGIELQTIPDSVSQ